MRAGAEAVAVEEDVTRDSAARGAGKEIPADIIAEMFAVEIIRARERRPHAHRPVIGFEMMADAELRADLRIVEYIADRSAGHRHDVDTVLHAALFPMDEWHAEAPVPVIGDHAAGLVLDLVAPALRLVDAHELVPVVLDLAAERARADESDLDLEIFELVAGLLQEARADIEPAGIRTIARIRRFDVEIFRREDALAEEPGDAAMRWHVVLEHGRNLADELEDIVGPAIGLQHRAQEREAQALGVMLVAVEVERIIFFENGRAPIVVVRRWSGIGVGLREGAGMKGEEGTQRKHAEARTADVLMSRHDSA